VVDELSAKDLVCHIEISSAEEVFEPASCERLVLFGHLFSSVCRWSSPIRALVHRVAHGVGWTHLLLADFREPRQNEVRPCPGPMGHDFLGSCAVTSRNPFDNLRGASGFGWRELRQLWTERGGRSDDLIRAVRAGPWELKREADGELCVYSGSYFEVDDDLTEVQRRRVRRLVYEGMSERLARAQVPVPRGSAHEPHADGCAD
jgi:hypothetical protein